VIREVCRWRSWDRWVGSSSSDSRVSFSGAVATAVGVGRVMNVSNVDRARLGVLPDVDIFSCGCRRFPPFFLSGSSPDDSTAPSSRSPGTISFTESARNPPLPPDLASSDSTRLRFLVFAGGSDASTSADRTVGARRPRRDGIFFPGRRRLLVTVGYFSIVQR